MNRLKSNKGISMTDIIVAIFILTMFVGLIGSIYYQIALNNGLIKMNAMAVYYGVKIAEDIDIMTYEEVTNDLNNLIKDNYDILKTFNIKIDVNNYNSKDTSKQDILKIVDINIEYTFLNKTENYKIKKLKVKEI